MKILQISKFYAPVEGGIESVVRELVEGLNDAGVQADVLCANTTSRTDVSRTPSGYTVIRASSLGKVLSTSLSPALIAHTQRLARHYDVIHVHLPDPMANLALAFTRPTCKLVVHWHSDIVSQRTALKLYAPLQQLLLKRADAIIATSPPYAESSPWLRDFAEKVAVIPIGIQDPYSSTATTPEKVSSIRNQYGNRRIIFSLGRMTYYKGFDTLISAAAHLPSDTVILIGGAGELLESYRQQVVENGLQEKIHFLGRVSDDLLPSLFAASDVFCLPSTVRSEAFGVVLLEAMAAAKPIVACDIPGSGVPWVNRHGETGFNVPPGDAASLATHLKQILGDSTLAETLGREGRRRYKEAFTSETMVHETLLLYQDLLHIRTTSSNNRPKKVLHGSEGMIKPDARTAM